MASRLGWTDEDKSGGSMKDFILLARNRSRAGTECLAILEEPDATHERASNDRGSRPYRFLASKYRAAFGPAPSNLIGKPKTAGFLAGHRCRASTVSIAKAVGKSSG